MQVVRIGLDLAKYVFEVHGVDAHGNVVVRKTLRRGSVATFFANLPPCLVGMEASNGAHYWARVLTELGHTVRLMSPQFVAPYVKSNKNDRNDAEARQQHRPGPIRADQDCDQARHRSALPPSGRSCIREWLPGTACPRPLSTVANL
jgi:hypothetical protein